MSGTSSISLFLSHGKPRANQLSVRTGIKQYAGREGQFNLGRSARREPSALRVALDYSITIALGVLASYCIVWGFGR